MADPDFNRLPVIIEHGGLLRRQEIIEIDRHSVRVSYPGSFFGREKPDWQEPVSAYKCVRLMLDPVEIHNLFTLFLVHPDRAKWLTLGSWTDRSRFDFLALVSDFGGEARARNVWREAAHALNLPAIETGPTLWSDSADDAYMQEALDALPKARMSEKSRPTSP